MFTAKFLPKERIYGTVEIIDNSPCYMGAHEVIQKPHIYRTLSTSAKNPVPVSEMGSAYMLSIADKIAYTALKTVYAKSGNPYIYRIMVQAPKAVQNHSFSDFSSEIDNENPHGETMEIKERKYKYLTIGQNENGVSFSMCGPTKEEIRLDSLIGENRRAKYEFAIKKFVYDANRDMFSDYSARVERLNVFLSIVERTEKEERETREREKRERGKKPVRIRQEIIPEKYLEFTEYGKEKLSVPMPTTAMEFSDVAQTALVSILEVYHNGLISNFSDVWKYKSYYFSACNKLIMGERRYSKENKLFHEKVIVSNGEKEEYTEKVTTAKSAFSEIDGNFLLNDVCSFVLANCGPRTNKPMIEKCIRLAYSGKNKSEIAIAIGIDEKQVRRYMEYAKTALSSEQGYTLLRSYVG